MCYKKCESLIFHLSVHKIPFLLIFLTNEFLFVPKHNQPPYLVRPSQNTVKPWVLPNIFAQLAALSRLGCPLGVLFLTLTTPPWPTVFQCSAPHALSLQNGLVDKYFAIVKSYMPYVQYYALKSN